MPRIDPIQLLKCLSVLLSPNGGIKSTEEVKRLATLMSRFSKKLVSKCIYIQILKSTDTEVLGSFMGAGGWSLTLGWIDESIVAKNWALVQEILELLFLCPVDVDRLKTNTFPKRVKGLSKDGNHPGVQFLASKLVERWLRVVKGELVPPLIASEIPVLPQNGVVCDKIKTDVNEDYSDLMKSVNCINKNEEILTLESVEVDESCDIVTNEESSNNSERQDKSASVVDSSLNVSDKNYSEKLNNLDTDKHTDSDEKSSKNERKSKKSSHSDKHHSKSKESEKHSDSSSSSRSRSSKSTSHSRHSSHKSNNEHSKKDHDSRKDRDSSKSHKDREKSREKDKSKDAEKSKHRSHESHEKSKHSSKDKDKQSSDKSKDKNPSDKTHTPSIHDLGKIPKKKSESSSSNDKHSISIEIRKPNDPNRPKTVKTFHSKFRSHGLEEEAKPPPPRGLLVKKPTTPTLPTTTIPKRSSPIRTHDVPPEKKPKIMETEKPGAIKIIPAKPKHVSWSLIIFPVSKYRSFL